MRKCHIGTLAVAALGIGLSFGSALAVQQSSPPTAARMSRADRNFIMAAARGGMAEVKLSQLAADRATNDAVKQFAQRIVQDHGKANDELAQLAQQKGLTMPKDMDATHQKVMTQLSQLSGAAFDRAYMQNMVKDHEKVVAAFEREASRGADPDVRAWATKTLPTLREHLQMARGIQVPAQGTATTPPAR
jgi:putative membrane protein